MPHNDLPTKQSPMANHEEPWQKCTQSSYSKEKDKTESIPLS